MKEIRIKAKSSSEEPYDVVVTKHESFFIVSCTCQAGIYGKICKHKTQLLAGDESMLFNPDDLSALTEIRSLIQSSEYNALLKEYETIRKEIEVAKRKEQKFRRRIEDAMKKGISLR